jgi:MinD superfamily P-loop ATPase
MRIPIDRRIAEAYSEGVPLVDALPEYVERFRALYARIEQLVAQQNDGVLAVSKEQGR